MLKIKLNITVLLICLTLSSCSTFQKTLNKGTALERYELGEDYYNKGKYSRAIQLLEKAIPKYQGKPQMERIQYMMSNAKYQTKDYIESGYYFNRFVKNYPNSSKKEEGMYMLAQSYYLSTSRSSLDQTDTEKAINAYQRYIDAYPNGSKISEANNYIKELQNRLEKKEFDIAYQYYHTENYKAAIVAFDNFVSDNLGTSYKEDALYYKAKAALDLATNSIYEKKEKRFRDAFSAIERLEWTFKNTKYKNQLNKMRQKIEHSLAKINNKNS